MNSGKTSAIDINIWHTCMTSCKCANRSSSRGTSAGVLRVGFFLTTFFFLGTTDCLPSTDTDIAASVIAFLAAARSRRFRCSIL
jgi:hypothetical protein